jgi:hypothetical protein
MSTSITDPFGQAILVAMKYARSGQTHRARQLLWRVVSAQPGDERAWLALAYVGQTVEEKRAALWKALIINPKQTKVQQAFLDLMSPRHLRRAAAEGVFISYARADDLFAAQVADDLRFVGVPTWMDMLDMPDSVDWGEAVEAALKKCGMMLVIGSPAALRAENVRAETQVFIDAGKPILPLLYRPCDLSPMHLWYTPTDLSTDYDAGLQTLVRMLVQPEVTVDARPATAVG